MHMHDPMSQHQTVAARPPAKSGVSYVEIREDETPMIEKANEMVAKLPNSRLKSQRFPGSPAHLNSFL